MNEKEVGRVQDGESALHPANLLHNKAKVRHCDPEHSGEAISYYRNT
ncbi:hypothetical protein [Marinilabilia sp.]